MTRKVKRQKFSKNGGAWSSVCEIAKHATHAFLQQCTVCVSSASTVVASLVKMGPCFQVPGNSVSGACHVAFSESYLNERVSSRWL